MHIEKVLFTVTDWDRVDVTVYPGETGTSLWRTVEAGNLRVRRVEYLPGYLADHWCSRGHALLVLEGELVVELNNGEIHTLGPGLSFQVADDEGAHRVSTKTGARVFIVD